MLADGLDMRGKRKMVVPKNSVDGGLVNRWRNCIM